MRANASFTPASSQASGTAATATAAAPRARNAIVDAEGIAIGRNPGTAPYLQFGTRRAAVEAAGDRWLGEHSRGTNAECGAGRIDFTRYGELTLNFQDEKLVGWMLGPAPHAVTSDGVRPGELLRDLAVARSVRMIADSTLDGEFEYIAADGQPIGGFASGRGRDARIASLYAGVNCFFR